ESRLDYAIWRVRQQNREPIHLSFLPLHMTYLTQAAPNIGVPAWEFPNIPDTDFQNNPRNNWLRIANQLSVIITHSPFTRDAFLRAKVKPPVHVVPVPIPEESFQVPPWERNQRVVLDCPCYVFPQAKGPVATPVHPWLLPPRRGGWKDRARHVYRRYLKPCLPAKIHRGLSLAAHTARAFRNGRAEDVQLPYPVTPKLE